jgi:hypothetical protein
MRRYCVIAAFFMAAFAFQVSASDTPKGLPPTDGEAFWTYITKTNPYDGWGYWPGYYGMYSGNSPHGAYLKLYANGIALKAAREGKPMPYGAILVKENYGKDKKTLMAITPMYKVKGYSPETGDWFWAKYGPKGKIDAAGQVKGCINCHSAKKAEDYIFAKPK